VTQQEGSPSTPPEQSRRHRIAKDPTPRFKRPDKEGLCAAQRLMPREHLARRVQRVVEGFDLKEVEAKYSALGQNGFAPRQLLGLWVYASLIGLHRGTHLARALQTDAALRMLSGGHCISVSVLNRFRSKNGELFQAALEETVRWAHEGGLLKAQELGVDSVRVRAHASGRQVRVLKHSLKRLQQLSQVESDSLSEPERAAHQQKVERHQHAVRVCEEQAAATVVLSNPSAGLMQFPGNGVHPGHRVTVVASGVQQRLVLGVLVTASGNDKGHLEAAVHEARRVLHAAGLPTPTRLQVAGDSGYWSEEDLRFAALNASWVDVLLKQGPMTGPLANQPNMLQRDTFQLLPSEKAVVCPAGRRMRGPVYDSVNQADSFYGVGCTQCPLRPRCTRSKQRTFTVRWQYEQYRQLMLERMAQQDAEARYNQRMATIEPVFASVEHDMGFRRLSSRHPRTVRAELLLKLLAHNISRLLTRSRLFCVFFLLEAPVSLHEVQPS
jgi:transposase